MFTLPHFFQSFKTFTIDQKFTSCTRHWSIFLLVWAYFCEVGWTCQVKQSVTFPIERKINSSISQCRMNTARFAFQPTETISDFFFLPRPFPTEDLHANTHTWIMHVHKSCQVVERSAATGSQMFKQWAAPLRGKTEENRLQLPSHWRNKFVARLPVAQAQIWAQQLVWQCHT